MVADIETGIPQSSKVQVCGCSSGTISHKMLKFHAILALALGLVSGAAVAQQPLARFEFSQIHMATQFRIVLYAKDETIAKKAADAAFARIAQLDRSMSDYQPDSELMQLCKKAGGEPESVGEDLFAIIARSLEISGLCDGAFDITAGPIIRLWRRARRTLKLPDPQEMADARKLVGYAKIHLDETRRTIQLMDKGMLLDLGGIAKGYAAQVALEVLRSHGIHQAMVAAAGDIAVGHAPPDAKGWRVGIAPLDNPNAKPTRYLSLTNAAVSTSGDAEQYVVIDGTRYSHIVDPRTGLGLTTHMSCTVIARDGTTADAIATALCVLGPERGLPLIEKQDGAAALWVIADEKKGHTVYESKQFAQFEDRK